MVSRPFDEMDRVFDQMDRMFDGMRHRVGGRDGDLSWGHSEHAVDMRETDEGYAFVIDLPGFEKDELDVRAREGVLYVDASHETDDDDSWLSRRVSERFSIPGDVDVDDITATYRNGVLEVTLPAPSETDAGTRIDVE